MPKLNAIGLIPVRLNSKRLAKKAILNIKGLPLIIHTYRRARLSNSLDDVIICCDSSEIVKICEKYNAKYILTSKKHKNGTERIYEAYKKQKKNFDLIVDIQGDEPLIDPVHIDKVVNFHIKNRKAEIVLPTLNVKPQNKKNIVKVVTNLNGYVMYLSRSDLPFNNIKKNKFVKKHLSIISFKPEALKKFALSKTMPLEKVEGIELLRALEIGIKIKTIKLNGDSFSVDIMEDYLNAKKRFKKDKFFKFYYD